MAAAKGIWVNNPTTYETSPRAGLPFWQRILTDRTLKGCADLEKLLVGCEIIVALDDLDLLAA